MWINIPILTSEKATLAVKDIAINFGSITKLQSTKDGKYEVGINSHTYQISRATYSHLRKLLSVEELNIKIKNSYID